jgi:sugar lactone lactonase YvrE
MGKKPVNQTETALGVGEGVLAPESVSWTPILGEADRLSDPRDLGFDPDGNLWIANREDDRMFIVFNPGTAEQSYERRKDAAAFHFMEETSALSFEGIAGAGTYGNEFGSCGESENTYNGQTRPNDFMGPVLWSANLGVFAVQNPDMLGSHLDMLHQSPLCVGITWEKDNVYWVFDGFHNAIVRYDFQKDHDIGQDDHSDGIVYQLEEPTVTRVEDAPGHMMIDPETGLLYVADTGGGRILRLDPVSGEKVKPLRTFNEPLEEYASWGGVDWAELVSGLNAPGGLAIGGGWLYIAEFGTGILYVFDMDGKLVQSLDTGKGPGAIYGIELGPDGKLWVADNASPGVFRLDF